VIIISVYEDIDIDLSFEQMKRCITFNNAVDPSKTIGYARVSTKKQNLENQINILRNLGIRVIFADNAISGKTNAADRPDFKAMMNYIDVNKDIDTLIVYEISRLGRNMVDSITTFAEMDKRGIRVISLTESWTYTIDSENRPLLISIVSWLNERESKRISIRTKAGQMRAVSEGKKLGRCIKLSDDKRKIVDDLKKRGWSWSEICRHKDIDCNISTLNRSRERWRKQDLGRA